MEGSKKRLKGEEMEQQNNSKEIVKKAIRHQVTAWVPKGELCLDAEIMRQVLNCKQIGFAESYAFVKWLGLDLIVLAAKDTEDIKQWSRHTSLYIFALIDGAFEQGVNIFGFSSFVAKIMKSEPSVKEFIHQVEKHNLRLIQQLAEQGVDGIILADDIAGKDRLLLRPVLYRELFLPSLARQIKVIKDYQLDVFFHSDGNYLALVHDLIDLGFDGLHCLEQSSGMDIQSLKEQYGHQLCLWGHLGVADINVDDRRQEVELKAKIQQLASSSGFILGTTSGLFSGIDIYRLQKLYTKINPSF
ncbi:MAG: hypothetical protein GX351_03270 [Peptococcaceae bacterium]|nr:hypothetical protein [Peptococcaceae bacterium]